MHTIRMTMQQVQVNTKFSNALPPEWSKFVTDVKLAKSLYTTNYDQLYAYLSQHERHVNEVRLMRERYPDPLALVANSQTLFNPSQSPQHSVPVMHPPPQQFTPVYAAPIHHQQHHTQVYPQQQIVSPQQYISPSVTQQPQAEFPQMDSALTLLMFQQREDPIECINKAMAFMLLFKMEESQFSKFKGDKLRVLLEMETEKVLKIQEEIMQLVIQEAVFLADLGIEDAIVSQQTIPQNSTFQTKDLDAYDLDYDDLSSAKSVLIANLSSCDSDVLSEIVMHRRNIDFCDKLQLFVIAKEHSMISVIDDKETLILEEKSRSKMFDKQNDLISNENKFNISPNDYSKLNKIKEDFGKRFVTQKELSAEQAFWLKHSNHTFVNSDVSHTPVKVEAPHELPKASLVNEILKKLRSLLTKFDKVMKNRTTSDVITAGAWGFEHTKACFQTELIPFIKVLKDTFNAFDKTLLDEITEVQSVFNQMKDDVDRCSVDKNYFEIQIKQLHIDNDQLLNQIMSQEIMHIAMTSFDNVDVNMSGVNEYSHSQEKDTVIMKLKEKIKSLSGKANVENVKMDIDEMETINIELEHSVAKLLSENENLRKEREHLKSIYKDQFDSIKKTRVFAIATLKNELRKLKGKNVVDTAVLKPSAVTIAPGMFKINMEPLAPKLLKNKDAHKDYIKHTKENVDILRELVENARALSPFDSNLNSAYKTEELDLLNRSHHRNVPKQTNSLISQDSNKPLLHSTGVNCSTSASGSNPSGNRKNNMIMQSSSSNKINKVENQSRSVKSMKNKMNHVDKTKCNAHVMQSVLNVNSISKPISNALVKHSVRNAKFESLCAIYNKCLFEANHDMCLIDYVNDVYSRRPKASRSVGSCSKSTSVESNISNTKEPKQSWGSTVSDVPSSSLIDCRFGNDHIAKIMGYGDYQIGNVTISRVYYVEGLRHNLFSVGQFCDSDLEVAFRKHSCFIRDLDGVDLLKGSRGSNLYTLSLENLLLSSFICLLSKALKTKSCLWHQRLFHLNFDYINALAKQGLVRGLSKLKYQKDHLCSTCALGKSKKHSHKPKSKDSIQEKLYLLHMDLCGLMRIQSINERNYILVIVDDYSRFTWVKFLLSKDEVPAFMIKFLKMIQVRLNTIVRNIWIDNVTKFVNQTLREYYEDVGITHQTLVARTSQQKGIAKRRNRTLVEAARTTLIFSKSLFFLWAEAVATACYTQNRSLICKRYNKIPYELLHGQKLDLSYLHVFGALCYPTNDSEVLGKLRSKADIKIFVGYAPAKKAFRIYNKWTKMIIETIHVDFDKLTAMASEQFSSGPGPNLLTPGTINSRLPTFDEYLNPPPCIDSRVPTELATELAVSTGTPSLTTIDQDASSTSTSQTTLETPSPIIPLSVEEADHDIEMAYMDNNSTNDIPILEPSSKESSTQIIILNNVHSLSQTHEHISRWTKDYPIDNVIGDPSRPVSTGYQLQDEAIFCYFDAFLSSIEQKSYKDALTESS
ncbi:retrovirus-related pol polyprotein from transposon TNT 1-94 [Tanacetum coccineum]